MDPKNIDISQYDYSLPIEKIAEKPLATRDASRLLVHKKGVLSNEYYQNIDRILPAGALMFFNNTRVIGARLNFYKPSGGKIEIFLLSPANPADTAELCLASTLPQQWNCLIGGASKWKRGQILTKTIDYNARKILLQADFVQKNTEDFTIKLSWDNTSISFAEILLSAGEIPLPPYIQRQTDSDDRIRYQTVFSSIEGSVAAPTAGLHFSDGLLTKIGEAGIDINFLTLHVGAGTFKPVKADSLGDHTMHTEFFSISLNSIEKLLNGKNLPVVAVGTTSLRCLESLYWMGNFLRKNPKATIDQLYIRQWQPYEEQADNSKEEALTALIDWMKANNLERLSSSTGILIAPGYQFKIVDMLITNFHQPRSTLLLLVSAFIGEDWRKLYDHALQQNYRFLSYGDGCLLYKN